ncbi:hypothetical protein BGZ58_003546 [Dissophora ornata]|nr:hypothetical protein BGZ58_003546 [Dissophora ornata]
MKADRKADPLLTSASTNNPPSTSHENHTGIRSKKRKAAHSERRTSSNGTASSAATTTKTIAITTATSEAATEKTKKRAAIDEHKREEEGMYADEVSGSMRKKRVLATSRTSNSRHSQPNPHTHSPSSDAVEPEEVVDVESVDEDKAPLPRKNGKDTVASTSSVTSATTDSTSKHGARRRGSAAVSHLPTSSTHNHTSPKKNQSKGTEEEKGISKSDNSQSTNGDTKPAKLPRQQTTTSSSSTMAIESATASEVKAHKSGRSRAPTQAVPVAAFVASPPSPAATLSPPAEHGLQKRVLPSRGGMLRDKTGGLPIEASFLEPPVAPAGEYILYLADNKVLEKAVVDPNRVPPATYGGAAEEVESNQCLLPSPPPSSVTATATSSSKATLLKSAPPPSAVTHIEVPIFRLCSISQFLQEEKKRKMQLLSKALAKAEAEAAAEALAQAQASTPTPVSSRTVSTRQKHKEIFQNQHVSLQTAAPSWALHSISTHGGRKATTTNTTLGKIEGDAQEEILTDEVYEKRHRKQEMAEKKVKNREKEKLRHAMYQQQLVVEKLRHMEINRLMPISAFRSLQKTIEQEQQLRESGGSGSGSGSGAGSGTDEASAPQQHAPISLAAARVMQDEYHRRLLREAEENLRRYEQLGLGETSTLTTAPTYSPFSRTKNRLAAMVPAPVVDERPSSATHGSGEKMIDSKQDRKDKSSSVHQRSESRATSVLKSSTGDGRSRKRVKTVDTTTADDQKGDASASATGRSKTKTSSAKSATTTTAASIASIPSSQKTSAHRAAEEPPRPPKPITTFFKPGSIFAAGARKSSRVALAFGERVPILERMDFELPKDGFGDLLLERAGDNPILLMELNRMSLPGGIKEVSASISEVADAKDVVAAAAASSLSPPLSSPSSSSSTSSASSVSSSSSSSALTSLSSLCAKSP